MRLALACSAPVPAEPRSAIVVCGERIPIRAPVVLWSDPDGFDAYVEGPVFAEAGPLGRRYTPGRSWASSPGSITRADLAQHVDLLMLHYDICGFSQRCYRLLQDERMLSAHFLLDVDGTLYQTLDLRDQAWHGRFTNPRSIGVEIANMGVYDPHDPAGDPFEKRAWYTRDGERLRFQVPPEFGPAPIRTPGPFYAARNEPQRGRVHGKEYEQVDFTPQQYATLAELTAVLRRVFPRIALDAPRGREGSVRSDMLAREELDAFRGILAHGHITTERNEPGPAFDWERYLREVAEREARDAGSSPPASPP